MKFFAFLNVQLRHPFLTGCVSSESRRISGRLFGILRRMSKLSDEDIRHLVELLIWPKIPKPRGILTPMTMFLFTYWTRKRKKQMTALSQLICHTNEDLKRQKRTREMYRILFLMKIFIGTV